MTRLQASVVKPMWHKNKQTDQQKRGETPETDPDLLMNELEVWYILYSLLFSKFKIFIVKS